MATAKTFMEVSVQDVGRAPLGEGEETTSLSLPVFELLAVATGKDGGQTWRNFKKRALKGHEDFTMPNGVTLLEKPMIGRAKLALAVRLTEGASVPGDGAGQGRGAARAPGPGAQATGDARSPRPRRGARLRSRRGGCQGG